MSSKIIYFEDLAEYDSKLKEQANILQRNKDYSVGTIVNKGNTFLRCTVAGKTANTSIDLSNYIIGDEVVYGTAVFEVVDGIGKANSVPRNTKIGRASCRERV